MRQANASLRRCCVRSRSLIEVLLLYPAFAAAAITNKEPAFTSRPAVAEQLHIRALGDTVPARGHTRVAGAHVTNRNPGIIRIGDLGPFPTGRGGGGRGGGSDKRRYCGRRCLAWFRSRGGLFDGLISASAVLQQTAASRRGERNQDAGEDQEHHRCFTAAKGCGDVVAARGSQSSRDLRRTADTRCVERGITDHGAGEPAALVMQGRLP